MKVVICLAFFLACLSSQSSTSSSRTSRYSNTRSILQLLVQAADAHEMHAVGVASVFSPETGSRDENVSYSPVDLASGSCGLFLILVSMVLAVIFPQPTDFQFFIFRVAIALAVGALGFALSGFISVTIGNGVRATGGAALFLIVYKFNPGRLLKN